MENPYLGRKCWGFWGTIYPNKGSRSSRPPKHNSWHHSACFELLRVYVPHIVLVLLSFECWPEITWSSFRPLDDVIGKQRWRILKERYRFTIEKFWNFCSKFFRFLVIGLFSLTWKIPISGENFGFFGVPFTQKWFKVPKTPKNQFLASQRVFWAITRICISHRFGAIKIWVLSGNHVIAVSVTRWRHR